MWDETQHPRNPAGSSAGGQFSSGSSSWARKTLDSLSFLKSTIGRFLSEDEGEAVNEYSQDQYEPINQLLREGESKFRNSVEKDLGATPSEVSTIVRETKGLISNLASIFRDARAPQNILAYRVTGDRTANRIKNSAGGVFVDKGFVSTSLDKKFIQSVNTRNNVFPVVIRKGAKALAIEHLAKIPEEKEILLDRGTEFKVHKTSKGRTYLEVK